MQIWFTEISLKQLFKKEHTMKLALSEKMLLICLAQNLVDVKVHIF